MKLGGHNAAHTALVRACLQYLALRRVPAWPQNVGCLKVGRRFVRFAPAGTPDVLGYLPPSGRGLAVEVKTGSGRANKAQAAWHEAARRAGALVLAVRDLDDLARALDAAGVP